MRISDWSSDLCSSELFAGEIEHQYRVRPRPGEQAFALVERGQAEPGRVRAEQPHRVRVESRDDGGAALGAGKRDGAANHGLVPGVKSVEIPQRHVSAAQMGGHRGDAVTPGSGRRRGGRVWGLTWKSRWVAQ